uniref:Polycomb protein Scm-like n=1 Tax=Petromyzon marinus TaxID=7757 RepID=A0AAJ7T1S1_PETMA|nr:polycomb protein Scm-like [Petromyzon marinus]
MHWCWLARMGTCRKASLRSMAMSQPRGWTALAKEANDSILIRLCDWRLCVCPSVGGYGFLPPSSAGLLLSQQQQQQQHGILRKHSLARLEMSADILRQKELESLHSHQRLLEAHSQLQPHPHSFPQPLSNPYPHLHTHHVISGNSAETARHSALMLLQQRNLQHQLSHRHQPHLLTHPLSVSHARGLLLASRASHPLGRRGGTRKSSGQKVTAYVTQDAAAPMAVMKREPRSLEENNSDNGSRDSDGDGREGKEQRSDRGDARHGRDLSDDSMAAEGGDAGDVGSRRAEAAGKSSQESLSIPSAAPLLSSLSPSPQTSVCPRPSSRPSSPRLPSVTLHHSAPDTMEAARNPAVIAAATASGTTRLPAASRLLLLPSILGPSSSPAHSPTAPLRHGATSAPLPNTGLPRHVGYARSDRWPTSSPGFPSALSPLSHARPARPGRGPGEEMAEDGDPGTMSAAEEEDMRAWSVDNVCTFVAALSGCAESAQAFRHHAIDGETLPLLTETHLLSTLGLRLGPALKILAQAGSRVARS